VSAGLNDPKRLAAFLREAREESFRRWGPLYVLASLEIVVRTPTQSL
jgi:hypothetical protein